MKRFSFPSIAVAALAVIGCTESATMAPAGPDHVSRSEALPDRVGSEKVASSGVSIAATLSVKDMANPTAPVVTPTSLAQSLAGAGVTIQNVSYTGTTRSAGTFGLGAASVGFDDGVILSSGFATDVQGPNTATNTSQSLGTPGDAQLSALSGQPTFNATVLSFDIIPDADKVFFEYVFSSEEYNEYVGSQFNDVFAFYINGVNCAVVGSPPLPVTVNTINLGSNPALYRNNSSPSTIDIEPDGLTTVLVCQADVVPNVVNTVKLAIADASDPSFDSWVFIKAGSFSTTPPTNQPPTLDAIADQTVNEGSALSFTAVASPPEADQSLTYILVGAPAGASINSATGAFSWTPTDDNPTSTPSDVYTFSVQVTDDGSPALSATQPVKVTVNNVAPVIGAFTTFPAAPVATNTPVSLKAPFTDPGSGDAFTGLVNWGDGSSSTPSIAPFASLSGSHSYTTPGVYTVTFSVADDDGGSGSRSFQYVVVYDPNGGFVTGGGWINSPAGAYVAGPTLAGRAEFGFVSKYRKGATVPDGQTQFQFQAGGLNFHSTSYDWLVIAGPKAQYKGIGTINGAGDYGFLLTANDGQANGGGGVDRFRLKIWDRATNAVVYDNQIGDADTGNATTALGGGSIVIHGN